MSIIMENIVIIISSCFFILGIFSCIQENLKQLLLYTVAGHCGYLTMVIYNIIMFDPIPHELLSILFFYLFFTANILVGFFYCSLSMKRSGGTYQVKSIYDLAQMWVINRKITFYLTFLLLCLSGFPFFPGFLCKWFLVDESFRFNKYLGFLSLLMCIVSAYPYLRIINHMFLNKNLMFNKNGPKWYFDTLINDKTRKILIITSFLAFIITITPSLIWFILNNISLYLPSIYR